MAGWLQKYLAYTEENEAPTIYHYWSGLTAIAHVLGRRVWLDRGYFVTVPGAMITILVGKSGTRKSTAINIATNFLQDIPDVNIVANKLSAQSLVDSLNRGMVVGVDGIGRPADSTGFAAAPELSVFLPKQGYVEEIVPLITDLFDAKPGPWRHKTRGSGLVELYNPLFTMLSGSTTDWLLDNIPINAYGGGFLARIFFVWEDKKKKLIPRPEATPRLKRIRQELLAELLWIKANVVGEVQWTQDGKDWYDEFYDRWEKTDRPNSNAFEEGYNNRRPEHTLRVAICIAAAQHHNLQLDASVLEAADDSLVIIEKNMHKCFEHPGTVSTISANFGMILTQLEKRGPQTKRELQRALWRHLSAIELSTALQTFLDGGMIEQIQRDQSILYCLPSQV